MERRSVLFSSSSSNLIPDANPNTRTPPPAAIPPPSPSAGSALALVRSTLPPISSSRVADAIYIYSVKNGFSWRTRRRPEVGVGRIGGAALGGVSKMAAGSKRGHKMPHDEEDNHGCMHNLLRFADLHQRLHIRKTLAYRSERNKSPKKKKHAVQDVSEEVPQDVSFSAGNKSPKKKKHAVQEVSEEVPQDVSEHVTANVSRDVPKNDALVGESTDGSGKDSHLSDKVKEHFRGKISSHSLMKVLAAKKKSWRKTKSQNIGGSQVVRTSSIHHLSKDNFVAPDELTLEDENYEDTFSSDDGCRSPGNEPLETETTESYSSRKSYSLYNSKSDRDGVESQNDDSLTELDGDDESDCFSLKSSRAPSVGMHRQLSRSKSSAYRDGQDLDGDRLVEKQPSFRKMFNQAEESSSVQIDAFARELGVDAALFQSKEFMEMLQLFSANRELFLKFLHDPTFIFTDQAQNQKEDSIPSKELTKLSSFPSSGRSLKDDQSQDQLQKETEAACKPEKNLLDKNSSLAEMADEQSNTHRAENSTSSVLLLDGQRDHKNVGTGSRHFKVLKKKIKEIIKENKTENQRISLDSVLHKVPYGEKISEDVMNPSAKYDKSISKGNIWKAGMSSSSSKHTFKKMMKSSSLTESLGRYSQLLESVSTTEPIKKLCASKSVKHGREVENGMPRRSLARILSLPDLHTDSLSKSTRNDIPNRHFEMQPGWRLKDNTAYVDPGHHGQADLAAAHRHGNESLESAELVEQTPSFNEQDQLEAFSDKKLSTVQERSYCNPNTALYGHEDILSLDRATSYDTEEPYSMFVPQKTDSDVQPPRMKDNAEEICFDLPTQRGTRNLNSSHIQVDEREEAEFKYVRDILHKSGFSSQQRALKEWHFPDQPVDPLLFDEEEECFYQDPKLVVDEPMITLKHMLLFDLINEVLLETYDASFAYCPWVLHSDNQIRPLPVGHRVLEEVWVVISKHLSYQLQLDQTVEGIVGRDFKKNDGWMSIKHDTEFAGKDLGDFIWEELIDEIVIELVMTQ